MLEKVWRKGNPLALFSFTFHFHALEKEMATHSSVLAWRIPGTGEPGGLPSMGSHRVGHDWRDSAAAAAAAAAEYILIADKFNTYGLLAHKLITYFHLLIFSRWILDLFFHINKIPLWLCLIYRLIRGKWKNSLYSVYPYRDMVYISTYSIC